MAKVTIATYEEAKTNLIESLLRSDQESTPRGYSRKHLRRLHLILKMIKAVKKSKDSVALLIIEGGNGWGDFYLRYNEEDLIQFGLHLLPIVLPTTKNGLRPKP